MGVIPIKRSSLSTYFCHVALPIYYDIVLNLFIVRFQFWIVDSVIKGHVLLQAPRPKRISIHQPSISTKDYVIAHSDGGVI